MQAQRLRQMTHPASERSLDHDRVAASHPIQQNSAQILGFLSPAAPLVLRQPFIKTGHQWSGAENEIDAVQVNRACEFGVKLWSIVAELQHIPQNGDATGKLRSRRRAEDLQRRAHRGRIGVVGFVDDENRPLRRIEGGTAPPAFRHFEAGEAFGCGLNARAREFCRRKRCDGV